MEKESKNVDLLLNFVRYCMENPEYRFWQALRNWTGRSAIHVINPYRSSYDTFYSTNQDGS